MDSNLAIETTESLRIKNLRLELQVRELKLQVLGLMLEDIKAKVPNLQLEAEVIAQEISKLSAKPGLEAVK